MKDNFYEHSRRVVVASHYGVGFDQDYTVRIFLTSCKDGSFSVRGHFEGLHGNHFPKGVRGIRNGAELHKAICEVSEEVGIEHEIEMEDVVRKVEPLDTGLARSLLRVFTPEEDE